MVSGITWKDITDRKIKFNKRTQDLTRINSACDFCKEQDPPMTMLLNEIWRGVLGFNKEYLCFHCIEKALIKKRGYGYITTDFDFSLLPNWENPFVQDRFPLHVVVGYQEWLNKGGFEAYKMAKGRRKQLKKSNRG